MTPGRCVAAMAPLIGAVWGCSASTEQNATVTSISPATAFNEVAFPVTITGTKFRPVYRFDTMAASTGQESGSFSAALTPIGGADADAIQLSDVAWKSPETISATAPAGIPAGHYDVVVTDPRGTSVQLDDGFVSRGPDTEAPTVIVESPSAGSLIAAGTMVTVAVVGDDGDGFLASVSLTIAVGADVYEETCSATEAAHQIRCEYRFVAPDPTDGSATVVVTARATDTANNDAEEMEATFRLVPPPTLISLSPESGPATGGTTIVVQGTNFILPGVGTKSSQLLLDGHPIEPSSFSATEIQAVMPRHDPGVGTVSVMTGDAESEKKLRFQFIGTPIPRQAYPLTGPVTGGTRIAITGNDFRYPDTKILIGGMELLCTDFKGPLRIEGVVPPGVAPGPVWIIVEDAALGIKSTLRDPYLYEPVASESPDGGVDPATCTGAP